MATSTMRDQTLNWIESMLKDVRQVMNSPWLAQRLHSADPSVAITTHDTTGPNFVAAACVLMGLESVGRLALAHENGTEAACQFVRSYFPSEYHETSLLIWKLFRHGHIHNFLPQEVQLAHVSVAGQVAWLDDPALSIDIICAELQRDRNGFLCGLTPGHLQFHPGAEPDRHLFTFCPQVAFADLRQAVAAWRVRITTDRSADALFLHGIHVVDRARRLLGNYNDPVGQVLRSRGLVP